MNSYNLYYQFDFQNVIRHSQKIGKTCDLDTKIHFFQNRYSILITTFIYFNKVSISSKSLYVWLLNEIKWLNWIKNRLIPTRTILILGTCSPFSPFNVTDSFLIDKSAKEIHKGTLSLCPIVSFERFHWSIGGDKEVIQGHYQVTGYIQSV